MKLTEAALRKIIRESFKLSGKRFGFLGRGFGKLNTFDPYSSARKINEEEDKNDLPEPEEDAWAGGENLENPVDYSKVYLGIENEKITEVEIRKIVKNILGS